MNNKELIKVLSSINAALQSMHERVYQLEKKVFNLGKDK